MARGTFKRIRASLNRTMSEIRRAFGKTAATLAKKLLEDVLKTRYPADRVALILEKPGDLWLTAVKYVYRAVGDVVRDKLSKGTLAINPDGTFNITEADVRTALGDKYTLVTNEILRVAAETIKA